MSRRPRRRVVLRLSPYGAGWIASHRDVVVGYGPTQRDATDAAHIALGLRVPTRAEVEHDRHVVAARLGWSRRRARSQ